MKLLDAALVAAEAHGADVFGGNFDQWCRLNGIPKATACRHRQRFRRKRPGRPTRKVSAGGQITIRSLDITIGLSHAGTLVVVTE
jgi:hypothetical protein